MGGGGCWARVPTEEIVSALKLLFCSLNVIASIYGDAKLGKHIILIARG